MLIRRFFPVDQSRILNSLADCRFLNRFTAVVQVASLIAAILLLFTSTTWAQTGSGTVAPSSNVIGLNDPDGGGVDPNLPPFISSFSWQQLAGGYEFNGHLLDEDPLNCDFAIGGVGGAVEVHIQEDGNFSFFTFDINLPATVTAQATDPGNMQSNVEETTVN